MAEEHSPLNQEPTLRDIMDKLEQQNRQAKRMVYFNGAMWGGSITFAALFLWIGQLTAVSFLINCSFFLLAGFAFFYYCWLKLRKDSG